jgi:serine O-acetyltransferase
MLEELRRDRARYVELGSAWKRLGYWVGATYRLGMWAYSLPAVVRIPVLILYRLAKIPWLVFLNVDIPVGPLGARIGPGLCLIHPHNILIPGGTVIGENFLIFHEVTLGTGARPGLPRIGNDVDIYVGARVFGGITVGDGSMIGANCVVTRNVPPRSVVVQGPPRMMPRSLAMVARTADDARASAAPDGPRDL